MADTPEKPATREERYAQIVRETDDALRQSREALKRSRALLQKDKAAASSIQGVRGAFLSRRTKRESGRLR